VSDLDLTPSSYEPPDDEQLQNNRGTQMRDQASIGNETPAIKYDRALSLFTESVMKPDHDLRGCAHNQGCYNELLEIRQHVLEYLKTLKEVTHHTNADESDEIETAKLESAKSYYTNDQKPYYIQ
tara:strand:- start:1487 stop:1861 length:375 start_codon:yes stop_codon:yes gene_type:complete